MCSSLSQLVKIKAMKNWLDKSIEIHLLLIKYDIEPCYKASLPDKSQEFAA